MTATAPAHRAAPHMTHTPDPDTPLQSQAAGSAAEAGTARPRLRDQIAENPLLSLFLGLTLAVLTFLGTLAVALLLYVLNDINDGFDSLGERIDSVAVSLGERIDRVETSLSDRMDGLEDDMGAGFATQGAAIAENDRKLTALVAVLNATDEVSAALDGRLLGPTAGSVEH